MTERPVLFKREMVLPVLDDSKTQTRRVPTNANTLVDGKRVSPQAWKAIGFDWRRAQCVDGPCILVPEKGKLKRLRLSPVREVGDHLWVRETFGYWEYSRTPDSIVYGASFDREKDDYENAEWKPSIHMPRWASRIDLEVLSVRAERLQEISVLDCIREGIAHDAGETELMMIEATGDGDDRHKETFADLWDSINAPRGFGWDTNPWVWVVEFKRIKP